MGNFKPIGPYSFAPRMGDHIFTSGHLGVDIETGHLIANGFEEQTRRALLNLRSVVEQLGGDIQNALSVTVFITDMEHYQEVNKVFEETFSRGFPPRSTVEVSALPMGAVIEISAIIGVV
jgi:2-iminobutanoate/2-iminopropanoate deaminase